jgi:hypothetical protein
MLELARINGLEVRRDLSPHILATSPKLETTSIELKRTISSSCPEKMMG